MAEMVRIDPRTHKALSRIAKKKKIPMTEALAHAVELYRREVFVESVAAGYAEMRSDSKAWGEEQSEREPWERTSADGLEGE
jgi:hypothetical protein